MENKKQIVDVFDNLYDDVVKTAVASALHHEIKNKQKIEDYGSLTHFMHAVHDQKYLFKLKDKHELIPVAINKKIYLLNQVLYVLPFKGGTPSTCVVKKHFVEKKGQKSLVVFDMTKRCTKDFNGVEGVEVDQLHIDLVEGILGVSHTSPLSELSTFSWYSLKGEPIHNLKRKKTDKILSK